MGNSFLFVDLYWTWDDFFFFFGGGWGYDIYVFTERPSFFEQMVTCLIKAYRDQ